MLSTTNILTCEELMDKSKEMLDPAIFDFISGGAGREWGVANNIHAFKSYQIIHRVLQKVGNIDTSTILLGKKFSHPIIIAPCAFHKLANEQGELATAKAAEKAETIFTLSTMSTYSIEEVAQASSFDKWFQLYIFKDREITKELIKRAENAGYSALIVTVDVPAMGMRMKDIRNKFSLPSGVEVVNFKRFGYSSISEKTDGSKIKEHTDQQFDSNLGWEVIDEIRSITKLPIILKGILNSEDVKEAIKYKVDGIIVSNHGGRQIDSIVSPLDVLPEIVKIVEDKIPIIIDGGIRNGEDIFKAIALGANAVMIGRPILWALSVGGMNEVVNLLGRLKNEFCLTMQLAGCKNLKNIHERSLSLLSGPTITQLNFAEAIKKLENYVHNKEVMQSISNLRFF